MVDVHHGKVHKVRCNVYNQVEGKEKLLTPKLNNLWQHGCQIKGLSIILGIVKKIGDLP